MGAPRGKIAVVKPGISLKKFDPAINGGRVRQQYGIKKVDIVLFFMGWLYNFSGMKEVALELAKMKANNIKLLIVGEGDAYEGLKKIRDDHGLQDSLILAGRRPYEEIPVYIAAADICLLPADPEEKVMHDGLPAKIYEYLAMAKPMISTKLMGVMREFGNGNGVVYIDRPEDTINKALEMVDGGQVKILGAKARTFVESYDWAKITDQYESILQDLAGSRGKPA
jgi:glycosyltransferase involved in cell wall biosynthesis